MNDIFNMFLKYNPDFITKLDLFPKELKESLLRKLKNATNETDFHSLIAEINFGLFFNELGFSLQYEKIHFNKKTPDWTISIDEKNAICEVYRLGQSKIDQKITDFENKLKRGFETINLGFHIKFSFKHDCTNATDFEIENYISELRNWLCKNRRVGNIITIEDKITFEIRGINNNNKVTYITSQSIDYKIHRLVQKEYLNYKNDITKKMTKYSENILQSRVPYFVCIENDCKNGFDFEEFVCTFLGSNCVEIDDDILSNCENEIEYSNFGCLYDNITVSGIIIKIGNDYRKIINPLKKQLIYNTDNFPILERINKIRSANT